jgi:hypothetical protein
MGVVDRIDFLNALIAYRNLWEGRHLQPVDPQELAAHEINVSALKKRKKSDGHRRV